jgi:hypothetical protein
MGSIPPLGEIWNLFFRLKPIRVSSPRGLYHLSDTQDRGFNPIRLFQEIKENNP